MKRKVKAEMVKLAKLRNAILPLRDGGDNFKFVGYGRVKIQFLGSAAKKAKAVA